MWFDWILVAYLSYVPKHFANLFHTFLKDKGKCVETLSTEDALVLTNEVNNTCVNENPTFLVEVKSLKVSNFF